jgi:nicotinamidase/pyrazinamidase
MADDVEYGMATALVVVDCQNDFADPGGSLFVPGGEAVVEAANAEIARAKAAGSLVVYTQDWHPPETPHFEAQGGPWPVHCVRDTWGAAFHPNLVVDGMIVQKGTGGEDGYSAFTMLDHGREVHVKTPLQGILDLFEVRHVVMVGLATDYCVRQSALDAVRLGFRCVVLRRAVAAVDLAPGDGERALAELAAAGVDVR